MPLSTFERFLPWSGVIAGSGVDRPGLLSRSYQPYDGHAETPPPKVIHDHLARSTSASWPAWS